MKLVTTLAWPSSFIPALISHIPNTDFRQLRNLEKSFGGSVRVCDRTALILDIFNQRAATHEAALQVKITYTLALLTVVPCGHEVCSFM